MIYLFFFSAIFCFATQNLFFKLNSQHFMINMASFSVFNAISSALIVVITFVINPHLKPVELHIVILAILLGISYIGAILLFMKAMECGPTSYTALIYSFGLLIPILFGLFIWKEEASLFNLTGVLLLFVTFYLGSKSTGNQKQKINLKWLLFVIGAAVFNGIVMVIFKEQQILSPGKSINEFLIIAYITSTLLSVLLYIHKRLIAKESISHLNSKWFVVISLVIGITTALGNIFNLNLCKLVSAVILFPMVNGGIVLMVSTVSFTVFKEKFGMHNAVSIVLGIGALFLLSM